MNKKLIALAVAGACVAPAAMAQTANPVTLYGRVYVTFESVEAKRRHRRRFPRRTRVDDQASFLGVRGTEDLGGGLKAFFQLETGVHARPERHARSPAVTAASACRAAGAPSVRPLGYPVQDVATGAVDPFGDVTIAAAITGGDATTRATSTVATRTSIQYWSPTGVASRSRSSYVGQRRQDRDRQPVAARALSAHLHAAARSTCSYAYEEHKDQSASTVTAGSTEKGTGLGGSLHVRPGQAGRDYGRSSRRRDRDQEEVVPRQRRLDDGQPPVHLPVSAVEGRRATTAGTAQPDCDAQRHRLPVQLLASARSSSRSYTEVDNNDGSELQLRSHDGAR